LIDTNALYNEADLATPYAAWETELDSEQLGDEICTVTGSYFDCTLDSSKLSTHDALVSGCEQVGGTTYLQSDSLNCKIVDSGQTIEFDIKFIALPHCLAPSCDVKEFAEEVRFADETAQVYEEALAYIFDSVQCSSPDPSSLAFGLSVKTTLGATSTMAALALFAF
jgi:hypothetical protein